MPVQDRPKPVLTFVEEKDDCEIIAILTGIIEGLVIKK
jgi:hypothetical protein